MKPRAASALFVIFLAAWAVAGGASARPAASAAVAEAAAPARAAGLEADIASLAKAGAGSAGMVGVAAWRLDGSGPRALVNADVVFPMASTFKVAVAGRIFERIDKGELKLDQMVAIDPDRLIESPVIAERLIHPGVSLSIYNLLELMLTASDNTATDYLVGLAGGPQAVTAWVRSQGVQGLRVDGATDEILRRFFELGPGPLPQVIAERIKADPKFGETGQKPKADFDTDPRDTTSPAEMAQLLTRIFSGQAMSADSTRIMTSIMERDWTGLDRLRGLMPPGTTVASKSGTIGGTINDVGVVTLPGEAGKVVVAVYIKASDASFEARQKTIAQIGRAVRDYYLYRAQP